MSQKSHTPPLLHTGETIEKELNDFRENNKAFDLNAEGTKLSDQLTNFDFEKNGLNRKLSYYNSLESYLVNKTSYENVPAPTIAGIEEGNVISNVAKMISLSNQRSKLEYSMKDTAPVFKDIDREISALKTVLLEQIKSAKTALQIELSVLRGNISKIESEFRKLPIEQQQLINIERKYDLSNELINSFLSKRNEASIIKAANVSDIVVIDVAKDVGGGKIGPNTRFNYIIAMTSDRFIYKCYNFVIYTYFIM